MLNDLRDTFGYKIPELFPKFKNPSNIVKSCPLEFWYDGQDAGTFTLNVNKVIQQDDKSGNARHVLNAVDAKRPSYDAITGRVTFNNAAQTYLQSAAFGPLAQPNTIFVVYKLTGPLDGTGRILNGVTDFDNLFFYQTSTFRLYAGDALINIATNANDNIHCGEFNGLNSNYWINGANLISGDAGANVLAGITLGAHFGTAGEFADCQIMEIFGYNCIITTAERNALNAYLTSKWSL